MKAVVKKKSIVLLGLIALFINAIGQGDTLKKKLCNNLMRAPYIFEGKIVSGRNYRIKTGDGYSKIYKDTGVFYDNFNSYRVEIQKVIKGAIQVGTIEVIEQAYGLVFQSKDGGLNIDRGKPSDATNMPQGTSLFFCFNANANSIQKDSNKAYTNSILLRYWDAYPISGDNIRGSLTNYFHTLTELYSYLNDNYSMNIPIKTYIK